MRISLIKPPCRPAPRTARPARLAMPFGSRRRIAVDRRTLRVGPEVLGVLLHLLSDEYVLHCERGSFRPRGLGPGIPVSSERDGEERRLWVVGLVRREERRRDQLKGSRAFTSGNVDVADSGLGVGRRDGWTQAVGIEAAMGRGGGQSVSSAPPNLIRANRLTEFVASTSGTVRDHRCLQGG